MRPRFAPFLLLAALLPAAFAAPPVPQPPQVDARSWVLMDAASGQVLAAVEPDAPFEPASLTKVMTTYVAFDEVRHGRAKAEDLVTVSEKAWRQGIDSRESRMFIEVGRQVSVGDLLHGIIVQSGNDASIALAEFLGGSEAAFAGLMNQYAKGLGLTNTHFTNATGVPEPGQLTTARDVAVLCRALIRDFPEQYALFREKEFTFNGIRQPNRNRLLWRDPSVDGIKTGHAEKPGYHLAASAVRDGRRLIAVVAGSSGEEARAQAALGLLNHGFRFYENVELAAAGTPLLSVRAWKGEQEQLPLGVGGALVVTVPRGQAAQVKLETALEGRIFAPVKAGAPVGVARAVLAGEVLRAEPLVALADLPEGGLWRRWSDAVRLWLSALSGP